MNIKSYLLVITLGLFVGSVNAQTTISFETSEGFTLGDINGQNNWYVIGTSIGGFIINQNISSVLASDGSQSLRIARDPNFGGQPEIVMGAYYNFNAALNSTHYSVSADIYINAVNQTDFIMAIGGTTDFIAQFLFHYDGTIQCTTLNSNNQFEYQQTPKNWTGGTWYNMKIEVDDFDIKYYVNNNLEYTGTTSNSEYFKHIRFVHDNYGEHAYIDNIIVTDLTTTNVKDFFKENFSMYPNPVTDVLNITSVNGLKVNEIRVTDVTGKVIKVQKDAFSVNVSDLSAGMYLIDIITDERKATSKFIKK